MNKTLLGLAMCAATPFASAAEVAGGGSEPSSAQQIRRAGSQASFVGPEDYFTGRVRVDPLFNDTGEINASGAYVTFESAPDQRGTPIPPDSRLVVISGVGQTQITDCP